jgi:hypothetical protein
LSSKEKPQSKMRPQGHHDTMITNVATPSRCIASTLMAVVLQKIGKGISGHLRNKEAKGPLSKDQTIIIT